MSPDPNRNFGSRIWFTAPEATAFTFRQTPSQAAVVRGSPYPPKPGEPKLFHFHVSRPSTHAQCGSLLGLGKSMTHAHQELSSLPAARVAKRKPGQEVWGGFPFPFFGRLQFFPHLQQDQSGPCSDRNKGSSLRLSHICSVICSVHSYWKHLVSLEATPV